MDLETPKVTADAVIADGGKIVLIQRKYPPFKGCWALPGGFVDVGEKVEDACVREALEETSLNVGVVALLGVYSDPARDPRGHTVSAAYVCEVVSGELKASDDAGDASWFGLDELPELAFDHSQIVGDYLATLNQ